MTRARKDREILRLTEALREMLPEHDELPSIGILRQSLRTSGYSLRRALLLLRDEGAIQFTRGSRIRVLSPERIPDPPASRKSAAERLYDAIATDIQIGVLRPGELMPNKQFYGQSNRASPKTVAHAFQQLANVGWIRKEGARYRVGRGRESRTGLRQGNPVILLVMDKANVWNGIAQGHMRPFAEVFSQETQAHGFRLVPAVEHVFQGESSRNVFKLADVREQLEKFGKLYFGALVVTSLVGIEKNDRFIEALGNVRKPVIWFDRHAGDPIPVRSGRYRAVFDEAGGYLAALRALFELGHERILFPLSFPSKAPAERQVLSRIRGIAIEHFPSMRIDAAEPSPQTIARMTGIEDMLAYLGNLSRSPAFRGVDAFLREVRKKNKEWSREDVAVSDRTKATNLNTGLPEYMGHSLRELHQIRRYLAAIVDHLPSTGATAVLAPSGDSAARCLTALDYLGVRVPESLSVLGLNAPQLGNILPVSFLDFGFSQLGYAVFHKILGDVPIDSDAQGDIVSHPTVRDVGSIGPV